MLGVFKRATRAASRRNRRGVVGVGAQPGAEDLEGDLAVLAGVVGAPHLAHPAHAQAGAANKGRTSSTAIPVSGSCLRRPRRPGRPPRPSQGTTVVSLS